MAELADQAAITGATGRTADILLSELTGDCAVEPNRAA